ncbi:MULTISPECIES: RIP metalloprotease RseP [Enterococcus]|uniref:Zinc metalloprotease n=1 Tax=Enterococcus sulfureus ATCC 49903 TaxID=1140003 RepID=S0L401_9ENTE|nr:RIP metalloprotease RseP [Enterococcus sulfureus]EOT47013.1 RIP metalloprotease RseP [Enterococcus sulfureus ATCC 49903]EOT83692.1 RIP metalloprotease RseP [Enterococcus sulfureus ATCC 49903]
MKALLVFLLIFSVVVVVHEFGHFYFAKRAGILVREFAIGMGPKIYAHRGKDGTLYTVRLLPLGGYVRMAGFEEEDELKPGMVVGLVTNKQEVVTKINTSKKINLTQAIPIEVTHYDLVDALTITGFVNGNEQDERTFSVEKTATIIEEDGTELRIAPREVQFQSAKLWQRMLTNFAGPMNNFILSFVIFTVLAFAQGGVQDLNSTVISGVGEDTPAQAAGLKAGDKITKINEKSVTNWSELTQAVQSAKDQDLTIDYQQGDESKTTTITPKKVEQNGQTAYQIGVSAPINTSFSAKVIGGVTMSIDSFTRIVKALGSLIQSFSLDKLGGPVAIFEISSQAASQGWITVLSVMGMISMNLGIFNLLPIPALDGGKLVLNIIEGVRGKPLSQEKEGIITLVGFGLMMVLMVLVTWNDIQRFFF